MDRIYGYTRRHPQKTGHPLENLVDVLQDFFHEYTETTLHTFDLRYVPSIADKPEEIKRTIETIENLDILQKEHDPDRHPGYKYVLPISCYQDALKLVKEKGGKHAWMQIFLHQYFNLKDYDYSQFISLVKNHEQSPIGNLALLISKQDEVNDVAVQINNDMSNAGKCTHRFGISFILNELSNQDKEFLQVIGKRLKIRFLPRNFFYYYLHYTKNGEGKIRYQWERITI